MSLNIIFREKIDKVNNFLNDPTKVPTSDEIMVVLKEELLNLVEENDNAYCKMIKDMQTYKVNEGNTHQVIHYYNEMDEEFRENIKFSLSVFMKISQMVNMNEPYEEQKSWLEELNKL
jgi:hypothetical protein